jgi:SulP family sulfate permease
LRTIVAMLKALYAAAEGLSSGIPLGLGAVTWIGYKIGPEMIAPLVLALFGATALANLAAMPSSRPILFTTRFFETSLLVGFIDSFVPRLATWGLADTPAVRLSLVMGACIGAAALQLVFYALRLQRLTRFIPAPVFAGFLNAIALILVIGQIQQIRLMVDTHPDRLMPALLVAGVCLSVALVVKAARPQLPAGVLGLVAASLAAFAIQLGGSPLPPVLPGTLHWALPISQFDWTLFTHPQVARGPVVLDIAVASLMLAVVMFLNTVVGTETVSQIDDLPPPSRAQTLQIGAGQILAASLGALPMSGSPATTMAALRTGGLGRHTLPLFVALALGFYVTGLLSWLPQAAMIGLLVFEAFCMFDRPSVRDLWRCAIDAPARRALDTVRKEDLQIIALVTVSGVVLNMVTALLAGMMLGLLLFAKRNGKDPIKDVHNGRVWRSNRGRTTADTQRLDQEGARILCVRLQGALYFGVARALRAELEAMLPGSRWMVLDWRAVVSQDTTLRRLFERFEQVAARQGVTVVHCSRADDDSAHADLDRALEFCENQLLASLRSDAPVSEDETLRDSPLLAGLDEPARARVRACLEHRSYATGEHVLKQGEHSRDLHLIVQGRADVVIESGTIRLAGFSVGAILGEMGFVNGTPRAADVMATEPVQSLVLSRESFDALSREHPAITQRIMQNLCTELAHRLRSLHPLIARERK